jgi:hypothetical protein
MIITEETKIILFKFLEFIDTLDYTEYDRMGYNDQIEAFVEYFQIHTDK